MEYKHLRRDRHQVLKHSHLPSFGLMVPGDRRLLAYTYVESEEF